MNDSIELYEKQCTWKIHYQSKREQEKVKL